MSLANSNDHYFGVTEDWQFQNLALDDLTDVIFDMDDDKAKTLLLLIANSARFSARDFDFAAKVWKRFEPVIQEWAEEKAELAAERGTP